MRWRLGSDRFRVQLSMETEPVEDRPAAPGRARRSGQAAVGFLAVLLLWGMFTVHGLVSEVLLDRRGIETTAGVTRVSPSRRLGAPAVVMVRFTDHRYRAATGELLLTDAPPIGHQLRVVYDPEDTSHVQLDDPGVPIVRLLILAAAVASTIGVALRYAVGRRAPFAVQAAVFLVIWLGGVLFWEPVVS